jgi:AraC family transcriptional regulator
LPFDQTGMNLKIIERPALTVVGLQIRTRPMSPEIPALWPGFVERIPEIRSPAEPNVSYGVMSHPSGSTDELLYMAAVSTSTTGPLPAGMIAAKLPAGPYAVFSYPLARLAKGFCEIFERLLPASNRAQAPGPYFERYDESFDPGNAHSLVEIYLPVQ